MGGGLLVQGRGTGDTRLRRPSESRTWLSSDRQQEVNELVEAGEAHGQAGIWDQTL